MGLNVVDASALLAYLQGEDGSALVETALEAGGVCGAANWSEVAQKVRGHGRDWALSRSLLLSYGLVIEPVTVEDAERAARSWRSAQGRSLADRLCLALGDRLDVPILTADRAWGVAGRIRQIR
ncbi:MAG TPA: PIN domain-containing protein [Mycobacteriales bacterium]|nr:PIN domain-containing protein [Mycobacteriales bacterium]